MRASRSSKRSIRWFMVPIKFKIWPVTCSRTDTLDFNSEISSSVRSCDARMRRRCSKMRLSVSLAISLFLTQWEPESLQRLGAGDDLDQLLGDLRLAGAVVRKRLLANHLAGIAGGVVHRAHLRAIERGGVLQ